MTTADEKVDAFEVMRRGVPMAKNGNTWENYDFRMFQLSQEHDAIIWSKKSAMTEERIPISAIQQVYEGQSTETFKADPKKPVLHLSFSIVWKNTQEESGKEITETYDLICCRRSDAVCWVQGLRQLLSDPHSAQCMIDNVEQTIDTSLACMLHRTKSQQAGRMAWAIPMAIIPIAGIAWLGYSAYYRNEDKKTICSRRLPEVKALILECMELLKNPDIQAHPFVQGDAPIRLEFVGECYEAAVNVKDSVLDETTDAQLHNVAIALAEAQAIKTRLDVIITDANKGKGWFQGLTERMTQLNPFRASTDTVRSSIPKDSSGNMLGDHQV